MSMSPTVWNRPLRWSIKSTAESSGSIIGVLPLKLAGVLMVRLVFLRWVGSCLVGDFAKMTAVEVLDGFGDFFLRVHHERPAAHDGFIDGLTAEQQHDGVISGFYGKAAAP